MGGLLRQCLRNGLILNVQLELQKLCIKGSLDLNQPAARVSNGESRIRFCRAAGILQTAINLSVKRLRFAGAGHALNTEIGQLGRNRTHLALPLGPGIPRHRDAVAHLCTRRRCTSPSVRPRPTPPSHARPHTIGCMGNITVSSYSGTDC